MDDFETDELRPTVLKDDDYIELPEDEALAFLQIEKDCRALLNRRIDEAGDDSPYSEYYQEYMSSTLAAARELQIDNFSKWQTPIFSKDASYSSSTKNEIYDTYHAFSLAMAEYTMQVRIRYSRRAKRYSVAIDSVTKEKIRHHLTQLKELAAKLEIPTAKREAIYARIVALEMEMERERTRFEVIAAFVLETASVVGQAGEKLEPWRKWIDSIASLFGHAKDKDTQHPSLPSPEDRKRLDPPKRQLPSPPPDDPEIPF